MGQTRLFTVIHIQIPNVQRRSFEHYKTVFLTNLRSILESCVFIRNYLSLIRF